MSEQLAHSSRGLTIGSWVLSLLGCGILLVNPFFVYLASIHVFNRYLELALALPSITQLAFGIPIIIYLPVYWFFAFVLIIKELLISNKKSSFIINIIACVLIVVAGLGHLAAVLLPSLTL